jgi:hypothetical protein
MPKIAFKLKQVIVKTGKGKMKTFIVMVAGAAALLFLSTAAEASGPSVSDLKSQVAAAQKQVDKAHADLDKAKENAEPMVTPSEKSEWYKAETKFENMVTGDKDSKKITAQEQMLKDLETRVITSSGSMDGPRSARVNLDMAREELVWAQGKLNQARTKLHLAQRKDNDDSSQATQPENRTQNGSNFTIRSQRDSENHPPLPASQ